MEPAQSNLRLLVAVGMAGALFAAGCHTLQLHPPGTLLHEVWPTEGGNAQRTNHSTHAIPIPLQLDWDYNASAGFGPGGPLLAGDYVIVANRKGEIHAVDVRTGKKRGVKGFGDAIDGTPTISGDQLFIPVSWGRKAGVVAHDIRSGNRDWIFRSAPVEAGILATDAGVVFVDQESVVHAVSRDGESLWSLALDPRSEIRGSPVMLGDEAVAVADDRGRVYAIDVATGLVLWTQELREPVYASMAYGSGLLFVPTTRAGFHALDGRTGREVWHYRAADERVKFSAPAVTDSWVIAGASDGRLVSLEIDTGAVRWTWQADGAIAAAPVVSGQNIFLGTMDATAHALDLQTGEEVWSAEVRGRIKSAPSVDTEAVYFLSEPRFLYRFSSVAGEEDHG